MMNTSPTTALAHPPSPHNIPSPVRAMLFGLLVCFASFPACAAINLNTSPNISLPDLTVTDTPQTIYSGDLVLSLINRKDSVGWILTGSVDNDQLLGANTGESLPAELTFKSITWISGGDGTAAGITISPDGKTIEADPGFGIGKFDIVFEIRYDVPAFPTADTYQGVSTFILQ